MGLTEADTPKGRLRDSIALLRAHVRGWAAKEDRSDPVPVFNSPSVSVLDRLRELWPSGSPARELGVVSPFFDRPPSDNRAAEAVKTLVAKRGRRSSYVYVKTEPLPDGQTRVYAPKGMALSLGAEADIEVVPLLPLQQDEARDVHSKLLSLENDYWRMLMIGSSNFTAAGLGVGVGIRNCEANLVYRTKPTDPIHKRVERVWPEAATDALDLDDSTLLWEPCFEDEEDGAGAPPLPAAFQEALFTPGAQASLGLTLAVDLPSQWSIRLPAGRVLLTSETAGSGVHTLAWTQEPPPFVLEVGWQSRTGDPCAASWPVNVSNPAALPPPEILRTLTLEELLEILASTRPLPAAVTAVIEKRGRAGNHLDPMLDPLKRLDSQVFLLRRTKRVARALDRLRERLERPALTRDAFEWRLRGVIGPMTLAEAFVKEARLPGEARFNLAELALALRRVNPNTAAEGGLAVTEIRGCINTVIKEIEARAMALASTDATARLDAYVTAAFQEALGR